MLKLIWALKVKDLYTVYKENEKKGCVHHCAINFGMYWKIPLLLDTLALTQDCLCSLNKNIYKKSHQP